MTKKNLPLRKHCSRRAARAAPMLSAGRLTIGLQVDNLPHTWPQRESKGMRTRQSQAVVFALRCSPLEQAGYDLVGERTGVPRELSFQTFGFLGNFGAGLLEARIGGGSGTGYGFGLFGKPALASGFLFFLQFQPRRL